eukprot:gene8728-6408_t
MFMRMDEAAARTTPTGSKQGGRGAAALIADNANG